MADVRLASHLLARLGKANRIGNLVGQFDFTGEHHRCIEGRMIDAQRHR